jgi:hypothetical protein
MQKVVSQHGISCSSQHRICVPRLAKGRVLLALVLALAAGLLNPTELFAQAGRANSDRLFQAEQSILSSLSARAVSHTSTKSSSKLNHAAAEKQEPLHFVKAGAPVNLDPSPEKQSVKSAASSTANAPRKKGDSGNAKAAKALAPPQPAGTTTTGPAAVVSTEFPSGDSHAGEPSSADVKARSTQGADSQNTSALGNQESISQLRTTNALLRSQLEQREMQVSALTKQVKELQSQLTLAEVEVERLSSVMDASTRATLGRMNMPAVAPRNTAKPAFDARAANPVLATERPPRVVGDVQPPAADTNLEVATVVAPKADLRLGPGMNHSALLSLPGGSRLAVEMRQGEWLRVFAPSGERAWINSSLVRFGDSPSRNAGQSALQVKGASAAVEEEAFRRLQRGSTAPE